MARDRFIQCKHYIAEKNCNKGKEGTFYGACQHCHLYEPVKGAKPAKVDNHKERLEKIRKKEAY